MLRQELVQKAKDVLSNAPSAGLQYTLDEANNYQYAIGITRIPKDTKLPSYAITHEEILEACKQLLNERAIKSENEVI